MEFNPAHPITATALPLIALAATALGFVFMLLCAFGFDWARKGTSLCGAGVFIPVLLAVALRYGTHWEFIAMVPVVAQSEDGRTCRDGCSFSPFEIDSIRAGGHPNFYYGLYAVMLAIVIVGKILERDEKRAEAMNAARYAEVRRRHAGRRAR